MTLPNLRKLLPLALLLTAATATASAQYAPGYPPSYPPPQQRPYPRQGGQPGNPYSASYPQIAAYGMFSLAHYSGQGVGLGTAPTQSGGITPLGGSFGMFIMAPSPGPVRIGADAHILIGNSANSSPYGDKITAGFAGLRIDGSGIPRTLAIPYIQFEVGGAATNNGTATDRQRSFAYQVQLGADFPLVVHGLSSRVEYGVGQLTDINQTSHTLQTFSAGLVFRFQ